MRLLALLSALCSASVLVVSPPDLKSVLPSLRSSLGKFGSPPYGSSIVGRVFAPEEGFEFACGNVEVATEFEETAGILLVRRGKCGFGEKVWTAQMIGAKAVLVIDDRDELVESVIMSDDEPFRSVEIPAFLLAREDGEKLLQHTTSEVVLKLRFEVRQNERSELLIWYSASETRANAFFGEFAKYAEVFPKTILMVMPHFALWNCYECKETGFTADKADCISGGRYCAPDPDGLGPRTGRDVLMEDLRQYCVFSQTAHADSYMLWFSYLHAFSTSCSGDISVHCSESAQREVGIDPQVTEKCAISTFHTPDIALADNFVMSRESELWRSASPGYFPALLLNGDPYLGAWTGAQVANALCASFTDVPEACDDLESALRRVGQDSKSSSTALILATVALLATVIAVYAYRQYLKRRLQREVDQEVRAALAAYGVSPREAELADRSSG